MPETSKGSVMIVDDCLVMRRILCDMVSSMGYKVICEAVNGVDSVSLYSERHPDIVLMDLIMPVMDGIDATRAIKSMDPDAIIIIISSCTQGNRIVNAINAGASDFITKPFLKERVSDALSKINVSQKI